MYFPELDAATGTLTRLTMVPTRMRKFRLQRASEEEREWLTAVLDREGEKFGTSVSVSADGALCLLW
jgi:poly-gamma-glutamate synthesis protein (capsule biosynthesis protein)